MLDYDDVSPILPEPSNPAYKLGDRTLKRTSPLMEGADVKELQTRLNTLGFDCGAADGEFGQNTEKGVRAFRTAANIKVDGQFGRESFTALNHYSNTQDKTDETKYAVYTVQTGDTLWSIAKKFLGTGTKWVRIADLNGITGAIIHRGDVLRIPKA